jgi:hypothetical protein
MLTGQAGQLLKTDGSGKLAFTSSLPGITATASEINILDGVTATASEINILDGVTATTTEINYPRHYYLGSDAGKQGCNSRRKRCC